jgi:GntP family gluconate:H+ symporter
LKLFGEKRTVAAITVIGVVVGIPIFCDSGYIILSGLTKPLAKKSGQRYAAIVCGLASGLYITHTLLPPHPGSIAGAANLGLKEHFGIVIGIGLLISIPATIMAWWFSSRWASRVETSQVEDTIILNETITVPVWKSLIPVWVPLVLIAISSFSFFIPLSTDQRTLIDFIGNPVMALLIGFALSLITVQKHQWNQLHQWVREGIVHAGSILVIVGAGGVFGEVLKRTRLSEWVQSVAIDGDQSIFMFLFIAWCMGVLIKTAQGSTTSAIIVVTAILAPLTVSVGIDQPVELALLLASVAGGTMMVSHTNDAYFWVISQFSGMTMTQTYRSFSLATVFLSITVLISVFILAFFIL